MSNTKVSYPFACGWCGGDGVQQCSCCGHQSKCAECDGIGLDPAKVNVHRFNAAVDAKMVNHGDCNWPFIVNWECFGRAGGREMGVAEWSLFYRDYPPEKAGGGA